MMFAKLYRQFVLPIFRLGRWQAAIVIVAALVAVASLVNLLQFEAYYFIPMEELSNRATLVRQSGDTKTAIKLYQVISNRASRFDYSSNYELGNLYLQAGRWRQAERYYLKAASNPAALMSVFYQLSDLYLKHLPDKKDSFAKLLTYRLSTDRKTDAGLMIVLASFYKDWGKLEPALNWYKQAAVLDTHNQAVRDTIKSLETV